MAAAEDDLAIVAPAGGRRLGGRQDFQNALDLGHRPLGQPARGRHQHGGRVQPVLGLAEQVGRAELGIHGLVSDQHGLGRARQQVDADAAEELALGLGDKGVAGADQHVDGGDRPGPERHGADRLDAAEAIDLVRAAQMHGGDDRRVRRAADGRRRGDDARHAGDRGGQHRHVRGRHHRELAARHIAADRLHRDRAVPQDHARPRLDLDVGHGGALRLGERADLSLSKPDVVQIARRHAGDRRLDLGRGKAEAVRRVRIELLAQLAHGSVAAFGDVGQRRLDGGAHPRIVLGTLGLALAALEEFDRHCRLRRLPGFGLSRQAVGVKRVVGATRRTAAIVRDRPARNGPIEHALAVCLP